MPESLEVLQERISHYSQSQERYVEQCAEHQKEIKEQIVGVHKRFDSLSTTLQQLVTHDQKLAMIAGHLQVLEERTKDYAEVKDKAQRAEAALGWINKLVVSAVILALLGLVIAKGAS